jgi:hypothetical protein
VKKANFDAFLFGIYNGNSVFFIVAGSNFYLILLNNSTEKMARFREKISPFVFGLSVGLLIGCAIFIFKLDDYIRNFRFAEVNKPEFEETTDLRETGTEKKELKKKTASSAEVSVRDKKEAGRDSSSKIMRTQGSDSGAVMSTSQFVADQNISVLKEELIAVKNIRVKSEIDNKSNKKDSLAAAVAGVVEKASGDFMMIEFWKTPLNSKGYKMSRNKIMVYGLPEQEIDVVKIDDAYYLRHADAVYRLSYTNEFRKMEKVSEPAVLARLN